MGRRRRRKDSVRRKEAEPLRGPSQPEAVGGCEGDLGDIFVALFCTLI